MVQRPQNIRRDVGDVPTCETTGTKPAQFQGGEQWAMSVLSDLDDYTFSASGPNQHPDVSYLEFTTPACPLIVPGAQPTITRVFHPDTLVVKDENDPRDAWHDNSISGRASWSRSSSPAPLSRSSSVVSRSAMRSSSRKGDSASPPAQWAPTRSSSVINRSPPPVVSPSMPRSSAANFAPNNFEDFLPPRQPERGILTRSASRSQLSRGLSMSRGLSTSSLEPATLSVGSSVATIAELPGMAGEYYRHQRKCQQTDQEKSAAEKSRAKGKGGESQHQHFTFWYESEGKEPLTSAPNLTAQRNLTLGDIFRHQYGKRRVQMWIWALGDDGAAHWMPASVGDRREVDQRLLSVTDALRPSWVTEEWYRKRSGGKKGSRRPY
ncbi:hypothetical protein C8Q79DRAFT_924087 [Trametes meyenii]|nr:hypothetical protein C8Q79DRAFT_924087 [Trametes meyenii]